MPIFALPYLQERHQNKIEAFKEGLSNTVFGNDDQNIVEFLIVALEFVPNVSQTGILIKREPVREGDKTVYSYIDGEEQHKPESIGVLRCGNLLPFGLRKIGESNSEVLIAHPLLGEDYNEIFMDRLSRTRKISLHGTWLNSAPRRFNFYRGNM